VRSIERYYVRVLERDWGEEIIVAETASYLGKVLKMNAGAAGGFQYHVKHDETFYLVSGRAFIDFIDYNVDDGTLTRVEMLPGESYHVPCGAPHKVTAIEDCVFFEAGTPPLNDRVRVESDYGLVQEAGLPSTCVQ